MKNKKQRKVYRSLIEVQKDLFPVLYKERLEKYQPKEPKDIGIEIAKDIIKHAKHQLR